MKLFLLLAVGGLALPAATISFQSLSGNYASGTSFSEGGLTVTVTTQNAADFMATTSGSSTKGLASVSPFVPLRFTFAAPVSTLVMRAGDSGGDDDGDLIVEAYLSNGTLLGTASTFYGTQANTAAWGQVTISTSGADYFILRTNAVTNANSVLWYIEDISSGGGAVPEPGTTAAMVIGLGLTAGYQRWRTRRS